VIAEEEEQGEESARRPALRFGAAAVVFIFIAGGAWAGLAPYGPAGSASPPAGVEASALAASLKPSAIMADSAAGTAGAADDAGEAAEALVRAARLAGIDTGEVLRMAFPSPREILAMLALDRDVEDFKEYAALKGPAGEYYRTQAALALAMRPLRESYERTFAAAQAALGGRESSVGAGKKAAGAAKAPSPLSPEDFWFAPRSDLRYSHPFALDVFFKEFAGKGESHKGPRIRAIFPGVVVASSGDWKGGPGASAYIGGGFSPAAGNGVVVYDERTRRYYSYFHLRDVSVRTGDLVEAGEVIGTGGNTGMNARKPGHGGHLHIEVFDCERDASLRAGEILDIVKG
jgi:murein DD-endopeptidase MepM/ murein hydrolase activator NlpD